MFTVRTNGPRYPISPLIYGTNQPLSPTQNRYGSLRMGGNRLTAYNWENNASNAGSDYFFQNDGYLSTSNVPGAAVTDQLAAARAIGAAALLTVPIVDHVAADKLGNGDVRNSGSNYLMTRFKQNQHTKPTALSLTPNATDTAVYQDEFVAWARAQDAGVPIIFSLDNEPDLWSDTHAEIHPQAVTYAELLQRTTDYAKAVKRAWPTAKVTGFVSYGFNGFVNLQNASDAAANGDFINYFLSRLRQASMTQGTRLVDYLDLHWYPEAQGGGARIIGTSTTAAQVTARVQAPRSLWDTTYNETSWVQQYLGGPIRLIPRLKQQIQANWPGTELAFTEWNYGAGDHISGGVATADVLGVFGRQQVGLATYWKLNGNELFADAAFKLYRNYDGAGGQFGDVSIESTSSNVAVGSVHASVSSTDPSRTVIVVINRETSPRDAAIVLHHPTRYTRLRVYRLDGVSSSIAPGADVLAVGQNAFRYSMPALSATLLVATP